MVPVCNSGGCGQIAIIAIGVALGLALFAFCG